MELNEILTLLKIVSEEKFVSMSKEEWMERIKTKVDNFELHPNDAKDLENFANKETREKLLVNSVLEASPGPPDLSIDPPIMKLEGILSSLKNMSPATFLTLSEKDWDNKVPTILSSRPKPTNKDEKEELIELEKFLDGLRTIDARKQFFVNSHSRYNHLQQIAAGTPANIAMQKAQNPTSVINAQGYNASSLYTAVGNTKKEAEKNIKAILEAYKKDMTDRYNELPENERVKYKDLKDFLNTFKPETTHFKSFEELEKSEVFKGFSDESKALYERQKDDFPMKIITLPFETPTTGEQFMKKLITNNSIKPMLPAAKKEEKEEDVKSAPPSSLPGATPTSS